MSSVAIGSICWGGEAALLSRSPTADEMVYMTGDGPCFGDAFLANMEENVPGLDDGGTDEVTDIGR